MLRSEHCEANIVQLACMHDAFYFAAIVRLYMVIKILCVCFEICVYILLCTTLLRHCVHTRYFACTYVLYAYTCVHGVTSVHPCGMRTLCSDADDTACMHLQRTYTVIVRA